MLERRNPEASLGMNPSERFAGAVAAPGQAAVHRHSLGRIQAWAQDELTPRQALSSLNAALILFLLEIIIALSVTVLVFSGPLAPFLPQAISWVLIGNALLVLIVTLFSSYGGSMAVAQDTPGVILAVAVASVAGSLAGAAAADVLLATVLLLLVGCSLTMGLVYLLLGIFKLGGLVRYLPFQVMAGFLAGSGWLLTQGGVQVASGMPFGSGLLLPEALARWVPAVLLGTAMLVVVRHSGRPGALAAMFAAGLVVFFGVMGVLGHSPAALAADGWLLGPFPQGLDWAPPITLQSLAAVDSAALWRAVPLAVPAILISVIALLLNTSSLELLTRRDMRIDHELKVAGAANLLSGLAGGLIGYHAMSVSSMSHALGQGRRLPGVLVALMLVATLLAGTALLSFIPRLLLGALLVYIGLALLHEWLLQAASTFSRADYAVVLAIFGIIACTDFLWGIGMGVVMTVLLFLFNYSRVDVVRHALTGATCRSRVSRAPDQTACLAAAGAQLLVLKLQGFIFFGTANSVIDRVRARVARSDLQPLRYLVIDFAQVSGLDASAVLGLGKLLHFSRRAGATLLITHLPDAAWATLQRAGLHDAAEGLQRFADLDQALQWVEDTLLAQHGLGQGEPGGPSALTEALFQVVPDRGRIAALLGHLQRRTLAAGEVLLKQGDAPDALYLVESGQFTAVLERPGEAALRLQTTHGANILGELGFFLGSARSASVVADTAGVVHCLSQQSWDDLRRQHAALAHVLDSLVIHQLCRRVVHLTGVVDALT